GEQSPSRYCANPGIAVKVPWLPDGARLPVYELPRRKKYLHFCRRRAEAAASRTLATWPCGSVVGVPPRWKCLAAHVRSISQHSTQAEGMTLSCRTPRISLVVSRSHYRMLHCPWRKPWRTL